MKTMFMFCNPSSTCGCANMCVKVLSIIFLSCSILIPNGSVAAACPTGEKPDNITWCDVGKDTYESKLDGKFDAKGLQPWFNLGVSFIDSVLNKEPYDIIVKVKTDMNQLDIKDDIVLGYALGMLVCVAFGMLFCLFMPLVGLCFCCCRCCGKCGGEMTQNDEPNNACKRAVYGIVLLIITLLMLSGVLMTFVCNDRMTTAVDDLKTKGHNVIDEAIGFMGHTLKDVDKVIEEFEFSVKNVKKDISDVGVRQQVADLVYNKILPIVESPIKEVTKLSAETKLMSDQLNIIKTNTEDLTTSSADLQKELTKTKNDLDALNCTGLPPGICPDTSSLALEADFNKVPNITTELENVQSVVNNNFAEAAEKGLETFKEIPNTLINNTAEARHSIVKLIDDAQNKVTDLIGNLSSSVNSTVYKPLNSAKTDINKGIDFYKQYDKLRWYAGVGLTCILLLIVVLLALGLMCGICGYDKEAVPTTRGSVSNCGGLSLMAACGFCFIFASLLMLLTTICFIIGAPVQKVCEGLENDGFYKNVIDKQGFINEGYFLGKMLLGNESIELTIHGVLERCRKNEPVYKAAKLSHKINISAMFNIKDLMGDKVDGTLDELNTNLTDQEILTPEAEENLKNLTKTGVENIDFEQFLNETTKAITKVNLTEFATNVSTMASEFQKNGLYPQGNKSLNISMDLKRLDQVNVAGMKQKSSELDKNVKDLKTIGGNLKDHANKTLNAAKQASDYVQGEAGNEIKAIVIEYKDRVLGWGYKFTDHLLDVLENELARCEPVSNIHDALVSALCKDALWPFNGFWLAIGFCLLFFVPAIIFSVKLAKHYRRMSYEQHFDQAMDQNDMYEMGPPGQPILPPYQSGVGQEKKLWVQPQTNGAFPNQY